MTASKPRPIALTIAGSDSSGGAGIQADLKTFSAFGVYGASVITALTAQSTRGVEAVHTVPAAFVEAQLSAVLGDLDVAAVKTGMLASADIVTTVATALDRRPAMPLVVDPVMISTSGHRLLDPPAIAQLKSRLIPLATLLTPNLPEAAALLGCSEARTIEDMQDQARSLMALGCRAVLLKGGHRKAAAGADHAKSTDVLVHGAGVVDLIDAPWIDTPNTHGTGCTLSAAIAALLARGASLPQAVHRAKSWLTDALRAGRNLGIGHGNGPVDHLVGFDIPD